MGALEKKLQDVYKRIEEERWKDKKCQDLDDAFDRYLAISAKIAIYKTLNLPSERVEESFGRRVDTLSKDIEELLGEE